MHHFHAETFNGIEAGARFAEYAYGGMGVSSPSSTPNRTPRSADAAERRVANEPPKTDPKETEKPKPTAVAQAREAIKDGKISGSEKKVVEKAPVRDAIRGERTRLQESVAKAEGAPEHWRNQDGELELDDKGKPIPTPMGNYPDTEHEQRVQDLTESKDKRGLDALDESIEALEDAGVTTGLSSLREDRRERAAEERRVAAVIEDKESLVGALEAEKAELEAGAPSAAENDYQELREDAQKWLDQFNANGGQSHEADLFGDDWDDEDGDITFDQLAEDLSDENRLNDFANVQGKGDGDGGDSEADMEAHIADVAGDDPELARKIALRYQAAQELQGVFREYNEARTSSEDNSDRIQQIDAEIGILTESIEQDRAALSSETLAELDENNRADHDVIPSETYDYPVRDKHVPSTPTDGNSTGEADGAGNGSGDTETDGAGNGSGDTETEGAGNGSGDTETEGAEGTEGDGGGIGGEAPATREVQIDYSTPERREEVLVQARERNLVPAENTTFDEQGQAVYTVQPNDSYWRISDMSDGKPPHEFDRELFRQTVSINSERFGRDPQVGLIHPNEQVVIPGRSIDELVALMGLPTVETIEVEPEPEPYRGGAGFRAE